MIGPVQTYTWRRPGAGANVDHEWVQGAATTSTLDANIQPVTPETAALLREGDIVGASIQVFTDTELQPQDHDAGVDGDEVNYLGTWWRCVQVEDFSAFALSAAHYRAICTRHEQEN